MPAEKIIFQSSRVIDRHTSDLDFLSLLLHNRGLKKADFDDFLKPPPLSAISPKDFGPSLLYLKKAVNRLKKAIVQKEPILIYGDYDVDGLTSTAILWQTLYSLGANVTPFIPDRQADGYGFRADSFFRFQQEKHLHFSLLITVDNGIVAAKELAKISAPGVDIIIVDHHLPSEEKPDVLAIIHSTTTSASVLSWLLARSFSASADLGLAALGLVADCQPLLGPNRSLLVHGLNTLRVNPSLGIKKLIEVSGLKPDSLSATDLGFALGPRLNAVGRLSHPLDALRLLCAPSPQAASKYALNLDQFNRDRQSLQQANLALAETLIKKNNDKLFFLSDPSFHPGVIGLVAGRLTEKYRLPSVVISSDIAIAKGSCRSIPELNIVDALRRFPKLFTDLGGHALAAGFSLPVKNIPRLRRSLTRLVNRQLKDTDLSESFTVDAPMKLSAVTLKNCRLIEKLSPFGIGNHQPVFYFHHLQVVQKRLLGSTGDHLKLKLDDPATPRLEHLSADAIAFRQGEFDSRLNPGDLISLVAQLQTNTWNGTTTPQLIIKKILLEK